MHPLVALFGLSFTMLVGSYCAGIIPLVIKLSEKKLKLVTVLGAGLLVGTALAVIIPEGVHALYSSVKDEHDHETRKVLTGKEFANANVDSADTDIHEHDHPIVEKHAIIGISLVSGFVFMLLVDEIGGSMQKKSSDAGSTEPGQSKNRITATLGLVVHAAADGVALGAAIFLAESHITVIVFLAIMLHKAPAAFGLVSFLLHEGFERSTIRKHLAVFSFAAPLLTLLTYAVLSLLSKDASKSVQTTGIAMLFSAGTFLYVATVHVLPQVAVSDIHYQSADGTMAVKQQKGFNSTELFILVIGSTLPLGLSLWHEH